MSDFRGWMGMRPEPRKPAELDYSTLPQQDEYISQDFLEVLAKYISPNIPNGRGGVTANPDYLEASVMLWFAATGKAFPSGV